MITMEKLRRLVGSRAWDYCVIWRLSEDHRFIELMDCCCAGADHEDGGEEIENFAESESLLPCKDITIQHPTTISCQLLAQLPSSISLHTPGIHAQTLISNQPSWFKLISKIHSDSDALQETAGTRVLVPVLGGLIELFARKQVCEDQNTIDFITALRNNIISLMEQEPGNYVDPINYFPVNNNIVQHYSMNDLETQAENNLNLQYDISVDQISLCSPPPTNFFDQFNDTGGSSDDKTRNDNKDHHHNVSFLEESSVHDHDHLFVVDSPLMEYSIGHSGNRNYNEVQEIDALQNYSVMIPNSKSEMPMQYMDASARIMEYQKDCVKKEINGRSDSDCSDQIDDEDDAKYRKRTGKEPQSKNLVAERRRRKKLNERLYALRALVPKISKLDRASILGDAIEFVKELQKQAKDLQDELDQDHGNSDADDDGTKNMIIISSMTNIMNNQNINLQFNQTFGHRHGDHDHHKAPTDHGFSCSYEKGQMEGYEGDQVEVAEIDGNKLVINVFCKHKAGRFTRLMEALDSLGLAVTSANLTSFRCLVSIVFQVLLKKRESDDQMVESNDVKNSLLLELARNPCCRGRPHDDDQMEKTLDDHDDQIKNGFMAYHHLSHHHI